MKTLKTICLGMLAVAMSACSGADVTPAEVAAKIDDHQPLTEADYSVMIDYCGDYAKNAQQYYDVINSSENSDTSVEYQDAVQKLVSLKTASPYFDMFSTAIYSANDSQIGEKNVEKVKEYTKYEAFPLPNGSGPSLNIKGDEGVIMDMPSADTSGVIADPDGIAVEPHK